MEHGAKKKAKKTKAVEESEEEEDGKSTKLCLLQNHFRAECQKKKKKTFSQASFKFSYVSH